MNVSAVIVTRGDVPLGPVIDSLPFDDIVIWDNSVLPDVKVLGRYLGMFRAKHNLIYVQDDDVRVSDPQRIADCWLAESLLPLGPFDDNDSPAARTDHLVANMPPEFRHDFYTEHALVGFGAVFSRVSAWDALNRWLRTFPDQEDILRCCDIAVTALLPRVLVDVPKENLPWSEADNRMYKQEQHQGERDRVLEQVLAVRDA